jgi:hypothetical protein
MLRIPSEGADKLAPNLSGLGLWLNQQCTSVTESFLKLSKLPCAIPSNQPESPRSQKT